jgi:hypothetical protein
VRWKHVPRLRLALSMYSTYRTFPLDVVVSYIIDRAAPEQSRLSRCRCVFGGSSQRPWGRRPLRNYLRGVRPRTGLHSGGAKRHPFGYPTRLGVLGTCTDCEGVIAYSEMASAKIAKSNRDRREAGLVLDVALAHWAVNNAKDWDDRKSAYDSFKHAVRKLYEFVSTERDESSP